MLFSDGKYGMIKSQVLILLVIGFGAICISFF